MKKKKQYVHKKQSLNVEKRIVKNNYEASIYFITHAGVCFRTDSL